MGARTQRDSLVVTSFVDANKETYGAMVFARVEYKDEVKLRFIQAKSRIVPNEKTTIPRLELLGASIGARLMNNIISALNRQDIELLLDTLQLY